TRLGDPDCSCDDIPSSPVRDHTGAGARRAWTPLCQGALRIVVSPADRASARGIRKGEPPAPSCRPAISPDSEPLRDEVIRHDPPHGARGAAQHDALGVQVAALAPHAADELPVGHAGRDEDGVVALDQIVGLVHLVHLESGVDAALTLLVVARPEDALDVSPERLDRAGGDDALRAAAHADAHVSAPTVTCGV